MKVKIGNTVYDSEKEPILLIFEDDAQRRTVASHLSNMLPKAGVRGYLTAPDSMPKSEMEAFFKEFIK